MPDFLIDIPNMAIAVLFCVNILLGSLIFAHNPKERANRFFFFFTLSAGLWGITMFMYRGTTDPVLADVYARLLYASATLIPYVFIFFTNIFPGAIVTLRRWQSGLLSAVLILVFVMSLWPNGLIQGVVMQLDSENIIVFRDILHYIYGGYLVSFFSVSYFTLYRKYRATRGAVREQVLYILLGTLISTLIGVATNLILPLVGIFTLNWFGQVSVLVMLAAISYAIYKHKLFDLRIVATEMFLFAIWLFVLVRALLKGDSSEFWIDVAFLAVLVGLGLMMIRSVHKELRQRDELEALSMRLREANEELQKVDQMKTEFLSLASHQLRTPLTSIKGYASMMLEGSFGKLTAKVREPVRRIFESSNVLTKIIADLLDVSKIEQGGLQYEMLTFSLASMIQSVVDEQSINAKEKKIHLSLDLKQPGKYALKGDQVKLRQVFQNLIDNAIKYTDAGGTVTVELSKKQHGDKKAIRVAVVDNGRGIEPETLKKLFQKFSRGTAGKKTNTGGSGLGLYLAKQIAKAHAGDLWAESEGPNKGSSFIAEFPQQY